MKQSRINTQRTALLMFALVAMLPAIGAGAATRAKPASAAPATSDCLAQREVEAKEKCMATSPDFKDCPDADLRCAPYRTMHALEQQRMQATTQLLQEARTAYAGNAEGDPAYLTDLASGWQRADVAWRASRDADCAVEPLLQGMSRAEVPDLIEACRVDRTRARLAELATLRKALTPGN